MPALPTVVIASRNRRARLLTTLDAHAALPGRPPVVVVDDHSDDGTPAAVRAAHPGVRVIERPPGTDAAARTIGVQAARTPLVAFSDDDSWWDPHALARASALFERFPRLGLVAARIVVEPRGELDPTCAVMRDSPLAATMPLPGPPVLGFLACGAIARREAVLEAGGFHSRYGFGGEEQLLAIDIATKGWGLAYVDDVVAHHRPAPGPRAWQGVSILRNGLWSVWLRRPLTTALRLTASTVSRRHGRSALVAAAPGLTWVLGERRVVPPHVESWLRSLDR